MSISYDGIGHQAVTFPANDCVAGDLCKLNTEGKATACSAGDRFFGLVTAVEGGRASVIVDGFVTASYSGTAPACGWTGLSASGTGGVMADADAMQYLVCRVNTTESTITFKL